MFDTLDKRTALLGRADDLMGRVLDKLKLRWSDSNWFDWRCAADVSELANVLDELGLGPLGKRLQEEAKTAAESWNEAFGSLSFLKRFEPNHDLRCMGANERWAILCERLQEVLRELEQQGKLHSMRTDLQLELLKSEIVTNGKAQAAIRKLTQGIPGAGPQGRGATADNTRKLRLRAFELLERISKQCADAVGPEEFGLHIIPITCRPDLEEAAGSLSQLEFTLQGQRLNVAFNAVVVEFGNGFDQDRLRELDALRSKSPPPPEDTEAEEEKEIRRWLFKRAVSELGKVALELSCLFKPTGELDATSASSRGDDPQGVARPNCETPPAGVKGDDAANSKPVSDLASSGGDHRRAEAVPLTGDEATTTLNRMLENDPEWDWKRTKSWLEKHSVKTYSRKSWQAAFGASVPASRGNVALVSQSELMRSIGTDLASQKRAAELVDSMDARKAAIRAQR